MIPAITPDPSQRLNLYFRVGANGVPIAITFTDSNGDPYSFIYDDFQLVVKKNIGDKKNAILMGFGSGLSLTDNVLSIQFTEQNSKVQPGEYFWMLLKNDYGRPWLTGTAYAIEGNLPEIEQAESYVIGELGTNITITINEDGGVISGTFVSNGGLISSAPTLPIGRDTLYIAIADFDFGGTQIYNGSWLFGPAGATSVSDFYIKP